MNTNDGNEMKLPVLPLRGAIVFPGNTTYLDAGRPRSIAALVASMADDKHEILLLAQRDAACDEPAREDLYSVGTVAVVRHLLRMPDETVRVLCEGERRVLVLDAVNRKDYMEATCAEMDTVVSGDEMTRVAYMRAVKTLFGKLCDARAHMPGELLEAVEGCDDAEALSDLVAQNALRDMADRQAVLECRDGMMRLNMLAKHLARETELAKLDRQIETRVNENMEKNQREYYLREQIKVIQSELGQDETREADVMRDRLAKSKMNDEARAKTAREIDRFARMSGGTPEIGVAQTYVEWMLDMPWGKTTGDKISLERARKILDADHYGLMKVKERILEYLAVRGMTGSLKGPILCLVGAPGVGKTSIAASVARALGRKFTRVSLGGVHDEAEIRGHRRTYVGAMPGRIVSAIKQAGTSDPVFLFDEIDKLTSDFRGDPASALLEALDPEQNKTFDDHYLDAPFDLSRVLFIATANTAETIPAALLDRMELIEVPSYTLSEKVEIAKRHLWPKQLKEHSLQKSQVRLADAAIASVIEGYTREAGVRELERELAKICRKVDMALYALPEEERKKVTIKPENVEEYLGVARYLDEAPDREPETGVVNGLAWTSVGGTTMPIEVAVMPGEGAVDLTGRLGDVMKESARTALGYIRSRADTLHIQRDFYKKNDLHIHVPEGAVPKDGPSAGVALTCAMVSAITGVPARQDVAMTGEVTLRGHVLPIGGVREKLLAAHRMGIDTVLLPEANAKDLTELPTDVRARMDVRLIKRVDQAIGIVLTQGQS